MLAFTLPLLIIFAFNMVYMDQLDSYRQPLTFMRFLMTFGFTYFLMGVMICIGVWFPVRKAVRLAPAGVYVTSDAKTDNVFNIGHIVFCLIID